ncbi:hypothetical protein FRC17_010906 [Serendipita sp. 399]|nr:hypothetical protein FRC17_010906 [Serendipita sp. 399]
MSQYGDELDGGRSPPRSPSFQLPGIRRATSQYSEHPHNAGASSYFPPVSPRRTAHSSRYPSAATNTTTATARRKSAVRSASLASSSRHALSPTKRRRIAEEEEDTETVDAFDSNVSGEEDEDGGEDETEDQAYEEAAHTPRLREAGGPDEGEDPVTLKERQSLINDEHPFGLPIWKPALYRKSRTVTREAETALHGVPLAAGGLLLPGNILWTLLFGWWLSLSIMITSFVMYIIPFGGNKYAPLVYGLAWYLFWPFGRYVEGDLPPSPPESADEADEEPARPELRSRTISSHSTTGTVRPADATNPAHTIGGFSTIRAPPPATTTPATTGHAQSTSWNSASAHENTALLPNSASTSSTTAVKSYGTLATSHNYGVHRAPTETASPHRARFGKVCYYYFLVCNVAPLLLLVCTICWALVFTIPMAKLLWELVKHMFMQPEHIRFCSAPKVKVLSEDANVGDGDGVQISQDGNVDAPVYTVAHDGASGQVPKTLQHANTDTGEYIVSRAKLRAGQVAPSGKPDATVLLCIYRAVGAKYYKYTVGGVNILFVNLMPIVFFVILDGLVLLPIVEHKEHRGEHVDPVLGFIASQAFIFVLSLASVIPLSYFIGMAVASISAQSSIGMGAVINATFGSIIEIILYAIALTQGKGRLVEGSIVGSILAGVLLMPGASMCSSAVRRKEQVFNAKSASVTSTMLIMAVFGTLTPTLFYQIYGNFQLVCDGCPDSPIDTTPRLGLPGELTKDPPWTCKHCYYAFPNPVTDPFYQNRVKPLMYFCATVLVISYLIGLWFSLRTHASQIWQNPRQLMELDINAPGGTGRMSLYHKLLQMPSGLPTYRRSESLVRHPDGLHRKASVTTTNTQASLRATSYRGQPTSIHPHVATASGQEHPPSHITLPPPVSPSVNRRSANVLPSGVGYTPIIEQVKQATKAVVEPALPAGRGGAGDVHGGGDEPSARLNLTADEFSTAMAVAAVNALRTGTAVVDAAAGGAGRLRGSGHVSGVYDPNHGAVGGHGGHDAPSWSRATSASVLLTCTLLYAIIAEILVDVVDVVLQGTAIDEKLLGVTLFALVPNTTEFMNAMSFAINGNISLRQVVLSSSFTHPHTQFMEIGSAYALQVCLLQIPAMVAFSAWYDPRHMGTGADTFTLIFPRWDVIAIILSIFLLTYTYIEAKSNYHRGSILILSYLVMASGYYFAPNDGDETAVHMTSLATDAVGPAVHSLKTFFFSLFTH